MRGALLSLGAAVVAVVAAQAAPVSVDEILSNPDRFDGQQVTLAGTITNLCQTLSRRSSQTPRGFKDASLARATRA